MSEDLNKVFLIGRCVRDCELMYTNSGFPILKGSLATSKSKKKGDSWEDESHFFDFKLLGKRGESLNQYLTKGSQIAIEGSLEQERWEKDGVKRSKVSILVDKVQLLDSKKDSGQGKTDFDTYKPPHGTPNKFVDEVPF